MIYILSCVVVFLGHTENFIFWPQNDTPDLGSQSGASDGWVHKNVIDAFKQGIKASRPIGHCIYSGRYIWALYVRLAHNSEPHQSYFILN